MGDIGSGRVDVEKGSCTGGRFEPGRIDAVRANWGCCCCGGAVFGRGGMWGCSGACCGDCIVA